LIGQRSQDATGAVLVLACLALVYVLRHRISVPPVFVWLGTISYSPYLLHYMIIAGMPLQYIAPWFVAIPVWLFFSLLTAWLAYRYVEHPLMRGVTARRTAPQPSPR
jgi:peptidoglycan/LPS O-acetylase OafA/YrhL